MKLGNVAKRILVSIVAVPIIIFVSYIGKFYFFVFVLLIALISFYEFTIMVRNKNVNAHLWFGFIAITFLLFNNYVIFFETYSYFLIIVVTISLAELFRNKGSAIFNIGSSLLGIFYIGLFSSALLNIREFYPAIGGLYNRGGYLIISLMSSIWICDSAAYFGGTKLGKHKLSPKVSPNKSWEGAIFGFVFAVLTMIIAKLVLLNFLSWNEIILFGVIVGTIGQLGDLVESLIKRDVGVKDSSNLIPGHGGMFDRFDSLLFTSPVILLVLKYFGR